MKKLEYILPKATIILINICDIITLSDIKVEDEGVGDELDWNLN